MNKFKNLSKKDRIEYIAVSALYPFIMLFAQLGNVFKFLGTNKKKITAGVLSFAMILTMIPVMSLTAFANGWSSVSNGGIGFNYNSNDFIDIPMPTIDGYYTYGTCTTQDNTTTAGITESNVASLPESDWNWAVKMESTTEKNIECNYTVIFNNFILYYTGTDDGFMVKTNINLVLLGENVINSSNAGSAFSSNKTSLIISGTGSLDVTAKTRGISLPVTGDLFIKSGKINATSINAADLSPYGVVCANLIVDSGKLVANCKQSEQYAYGISCESITMNGGYVTTEAQSSGSYASYGLRLKSSSSTCNINGGTLTAISLNTSGSAFLPNYGKVSYGKDCAATVWAGNNTDSADIVTNVTNNTYSSNKYVKISDNIAYPTSWEDLQAKINESEKIKLTQDIVALSTDSSLNVPSDVTATIDLNGYKIDRAMAGYEYHGYVIKINSGGNLTIDDTSTAKTGTITGANCNGIAGGIYNSDGNFTMNGGNITGNKSNYGGGVFASGGNFTMNGGSITNNTANYGGGVYNSDGNFTMNGGIITENTANEGGGVYNYDIFNVSGNATIKNNTLKDGQTKSNVFLRGNRYITITDSLTGQIGLTSGSTSNPVTIAKTSNYTLKQSDIEMLSSDLDGFEISLSDSVALLLKKWESQTDYAWSGSEKQSNLTIKTLAGLKYFEYLVNNQSCNFDGYTVTLANDITEAYSGNPIAITFDKGFKGTFDGNGHSINLDMDFDEANQYLKCGLFGYNCGTIKNVTVTGSVINNYPYTESGAGGIAGENDGTIAKCVSKANITGRHVTGGISGRNNGKILNCYTTGTLVGRGQSAGTSGDIGSGNAYVGGIAGYSKSEFDIYISSEIQNCYTTATSTATTLGNAYSSGITGGVSSYSSLTATVKNNYYLNEATAIANEGYSDSSNCTVENNEKKTAGQYASGEVCYLLNGSSSDEATLVWYQNVDIYTIDAYPLLDSTHKIVYKNGEVYSNVDQNIDSWAKLQTAIDKGGNVKLTKDVVASYNDRSLKILSGQTVTIDLNGFKIDRALTSAETGGYVFYINGGNLTINDTSSVKTGKITGGYQRGDGGGMFIQDGEVTMNGGSITGNTATGDGGGILKLDGTFTMTGGSITKNKATFGGGIFNNRSTINITGGSITENTATENGGGIYNYEVLNVSGNVTIKNNTLTNGEVKSNVYLPTDYYITVIGALTGKIGVTSESTSYSVTVVKTNNYTMTDSDLSQLYSDDKTLELSLDTIANSIVLKESVYSVDISWGSMEFTYGGETWNVENHKWENGSWTCDQDADKLTVTNNGNVDVTATLSYLKTDSAFDVNFKDSDETPISSLSLESSDTKSAYIVVMGIPTDDLDKRQIGTVTVVIN